MHDNVRAEEIFMEMIVLGIDHELQSQDPRLKTLISELVEHEGVTMIAEENRCFSNTLGRQVSESTNLPWIQIDMSTEDRMKAGIDEKLANRMQIRGYDTKGAPIPAIRYAPVEDGIREEFWLDRIEGAVKEGKVLVICGCLHCVPFSEKAERRGHRVVLGLFHPENLSELKPELY
jgi:hypothetical protein